MASQTQTHIKAQRFIRAGKKRTKLFVAQSGPFGAPFLNPQNPPKKFYVYVPLLRSFPGNEAHKFFILGGPKSEVLGWAAKSLCCKSLCVFSVPCFSYAISQILRPCRPSTAVLRPSGPKTAKKSPKSLPAPSSPESPKRPEKVNKSSEKYHFDFSTSSGLF